MCGARKVGSNGDWCPLEQAETTAGGSAYGEGNRNILGHPWSRYRGLQRL